MELLLYDQHPNNETKLHPQGAYLVQIVQRKAKDSIDKNLSYRPDIQFSSVQQLSHVRLFAIPLNAARQASLSSINSQNLLKVMSIQSVMPFNHLILCCPLLLPLSIFFLNKCIYFNWRLITLQYCIVFPIRHHVSTTGIYIQNSLLDSVGEGEGGMIWENGIEHV